MSKITKTSSQNSVFSITTELILDQKRLPPITDSITKAIETLTNPIALIYKALDVPHFNINAKDSKGRTPLVVAAERGRYLFALFSPPGLIFSGNIHRYPCFIFPIFSHFFPFFHRKITSCTMSFTSRS